MKNRIIDTSIKINASPAKVWRVFTDPVATRQMGGEYVSDWKVGSSFIFKGLDGRIYTYGEILEIETEKVLKHRLFNPEEKTSIISVITYTLTPAGGETNLFAREEFTHGITGDAYEETIKEWNTALGVVKAIAESL